MYYGIDPTSLHQILISPGGFNNFLKTYVKDYREQQLGEVIDNIFELFEKRSVFLIQREYDHYDRFHVNEEWYQSYKTGIPFIDKNKNQV